MRKQGFFLLLLVAVLLLGSCAPTPATGTTLEPSVNAMTEGTESETMNTDSNKALPAPDGINAANLIDYLNRDDVLYIDIRNYEEYVQGHFRNFELIPFAALVHSIDAVENKNSVQLFGGFPEDPKPVYDRSDEILEELFPKDKNLFLVCRSGNRVGALILILQARGWDPAKLYNLGGMLDYENQPAYAGLIFKSAVHQGQAAYQVGGLERLEP